MIFVFKYVEQVTHEYHPEGGVVIVAESREAAEHLARSVPSLHLTTADWDNVIIDPHHQIFLFPDSGCC